MNLTSSFRFCVLSAVMIISGCSWDDSPNKKVTTLPPASAGTVPSDQSQPPPAITTDQSPPVADTIPTDDGSIIPLIKLPTKRIKGIDYPYAIKTKWPGYVKSPYAQDNKILVDVTKIDSGKLAKCPHTGKFFVVP